MKYFVIFLILIGFSGIAFATHDPNQPYSHSIILPFDMKEKTFEEFMEWCKPYYGERCTELYEKNLVSNVLSPLKQIKDGIQFHNVQCKEDLVLVQRGNTEKSACVTLFTKIEMIIRGWADDDRLLLGCVGERVQKCYPADPHEYRIRLYHYYFGSDDSLPTSRDLNISKLHTYNACGEKPTICYGEFDNGTDVRIQCDYPIHGCLVPFDKNKFQD